jgi:transcriptional/translational regulatory protein YebC/TACO1
MLASVRDEISKLGYVLKEAELIKEAKMEKELSTGDLEKVQWAIERMEEHNDVQEVWSDIKGD